MTWELSETLYEVYFDQIDQAVTNTLLDAGEELIAPTALDVNDEVILGVLGCGAWGCVYETQTLRSEWVVKVTTDEAEGPLNWLVWEHEELRQHPGVAFMLGIWRLPEAYPAYLILRENIEPFRPPDPRGYSRRKELPIARLLRELGGRANVLYQRPGSATHEGRFLRQLDKLRQFDRLVDVADFIELFYELTGIPLMDVHARNVGMRPDSDRLVVFDIGMSMPGKAIGEEMPRLSNPVSWADIPVL